MLPSLTSTQLRHPQACRAFLSSHFIDCGSTKVCLWRQRAAQLFPMSSVQFAASSCRQLRLVPEGTNVYGASLQAVCQPGFWKCTTSIYAVFQCCPLPVKCL